MKIFSCGDVVPGCKKKFCHETETEVLTSVAAHARQDHGMFEIPSALLLRVRSLITEAA